MATRKLTKKERLIKLRNEILSEMEEIEDNMYVGCDYDYDIDEFIEDEYMDDDDQERYEELLDMLEEVDKDLLKLK